MAPSKPLIYAELLSNIRQVSVIAALDAPCDTSTKVALSGDGRQFVLFYHGDTHTLDLPGQVNPQSQLQKPVLGSRELSWRLPLLSEVKRASQEDAQSCDAPWSAKVLGSDEEFSCKNCGAVILKKGVIKSWRDLPSENWAEMMDFWHCHKPDVEIEDAANDHKHDQRDSLEHNLTERGYGANTKITARFGIGLVSIAAFLVSEENCTNISLIKSSRAPTSNTSHFTSFPENTQPSDIPALSTPTTTVQSASANNTSSSAPTVSVITPIDAQCTCPTQLSSCKMLGTFALLRE